MEILVYIGLEIGKGYLYSVVRSLRRFTVNTTERRQIVSNLCSNLSFLVSSVITPFSSTADKEYGSYSCGISIKDGSLSISLRTKSAKTPVYSIYIRYGYSYRLRRISWYIQSYPYKRGKKDRFLEVSLDVDTLDNSCFELLLRVVSKDTQLKAFGRLVDLWVRDIKSLNS